MKRQKILSGKRIATLLLAISMLFTYCLPSGADLSFGGNAADNAPFNFFDVVGSADSGFIAAAVEIINANASENVFMAISMELGEPEYSIDGIVERTAQPAALEDGELYLPVADIAMAIGAEVTIDAEAGTLILTTPDNEPHVIDLPEIDGTQDLKDSGENAPDLQGGGAMGMRDNESYDICIESSESHDKRIESYKTHDKPDLYSERRIPKSLPASKLKEALDLEVRVTNDTVIITKPYQLKQIILYVKGGRRLADFYGATEYAANGKGAYFLQYATDEAARAAYEKYASDPHIEYVTVNTVTIPEALPERWGAERIGADPFAGYLRESGKTDEPLLVAIIDTGVDVKHQYLKGRTAPGYNFVDKNQADNPYDVQGHGTFLAGTVADLTPPCVKIMPIKTLTDEGKYYNHFIISNGIKYAVDNGAKVINLSLGGYCYDDNCLHLQAIEYAAQHGATTIAAAGNKTEDASDICPAKSPVAITVSVTDSDDHVVGYSNYGDPVDLAAPGYRIFGIYPNNMYGYMNGTSAAAAHASGAVALLTLEYPEYTPQEIKNKLKSLTSPFPESYYANYGVGIIDLNKFFEESEQPEIKLNINRLEIKRISDKYTLHQLEATVTPEDLDDIGVTYSSDNPEVAVCDENGLVEIVGNGTATITAALGAYGVSDACVIDVDVDDSGFWISEAAESFEGGAGLEDDPYLIATAGQLALLAKNSFLMKKGGGFKGEYFKLANDIDLAGKEWIAVGRGDFGGDFSGGGRIIRNMRQSASNIDYDIMNGGLFCFVTGCVRDLGIEDARVFGPTNFFLGVMASVVYGGRIENCYTTGESTNSAFVGAACGFFKEDDSGIDVYKPSYINNCYSTAAATEFINSLNHAFINNCYYRGAADFVNLSGPLGSTAGNGITNCFIDNLGSKASFFLKNKNDTILSNCYYRDNGNIGIQFDNDPTTTDLNAKQVDFFKSALNYKNEKFWNAAYPWDFDTIWGISGIINGGLPYLKAFVPQIEKVAAPAIEARDYIEGVSITLSTQTEGASIYYTLDGSDPDGSADKYGASPILITQPWIMNIVKAVAVLDGMEDSDVSEYVFTLYASGAPAAEPGSGPVKAGAEIRLSASDVGASIFYTLDGSEPNWKNGIPYLKPIVITGPTQIKAKSYKSGYAPSLTSTFDYDIAADEQCVKPAINLSDTLYGKYVKIDSLTEGAVLRYTIDGSDPSAYGVAVESGAEIPFTTPGDFFVKAMAAKDGMIDSETAELKFKVEQVEKPLAAPGPGVVEIGTSVTLRSNTPESVIRYTTDGTPSHIYSDIYTKPIVIAESTIIDAVAYKYGYVPSDAARYAYSVAVHAEQAEAPGFDVIDTMYGVTVKLETQTAGAVIYYTVDGSVPTRSGIRYDGSGYEILTSKTVFIQAIAVKDGLSDSQISGVTVTVERAAAPVAAPGSGILESGAKVSLTSTTPGAMIFYTLDGSAPNEKSVRYISPITIERDTTVKAKTYLPGYVPSETAEFTYAVKQGGQAAMPWFDTIDVINGKEIYLESLTAGAEIYYTLDGSNPSLFGKLYKDRIGLYEAVNTRIYAIAKKEGLADSQIASLTVEVEQVGEVKSTVAPGLVDGGKAVGLSTATPGAEIRYTTDGSTPNERSELYVSPIAIESDATIKAKAYKPGMAAGKTESFAYTVVKLDPPDEEEPGDQTGGDGDKPDDKKDDEKQGDGKPDDKKDDDKQGDNKDDDKQGDNKPDDKKDDGKQDDKQSDKKGDDKQGENPDDKQGGKQDDKQGDGADSEQKGETDGVPKSPNDGYIAMRRYYGSFSGGGARKIDPIRLRPEQTEPAQTEIKTNKPAKTAANVKRPAANVKMCIQNFNDVNVGDWFFDDVTYVCSNGLFGGLSETEFGPGLPMSRAMVVTVLYRAYGSPDIGGLSNPFGDVTAESYYYAPVLWAAENGIVMGNGLGGFNPDGFVTRQQLAAILFRYSTFTGGPLQDSEAGASEDTLYEALAGCYHDAGEIDSYAWAPVLALYLNEIMTGGADNKFYPDEYGTRAQTAAVLRRYMEASSAA